MDIDMAGGVAFMASHARLLERRRLAFLLGKGAARCARACLADHGHPPLRGAHRGPRPARRPGGQRDDGGWAVGFESPPAAGALEWRGYATVSAVKTLLAHQDG